MKKILVTGGAGFIGSHLVEELAKDKSNEIIVVDNLSVTDKNLNLLNKWGVKSYNKNIGDYDDIKNLFEGVNVVFHLAAMNRAQRSIQNPLEANKSNIDGTLNCLEASKTAGVDKFVFVSSSSVYAGQRNKLLVEDMPLAPPHPYGVGKLAGEHYARIYHSLYGLKTVVLRFFSVYGPRQLGDIENAAVIPKFIDAICNDKTVEVYGDGTQTRNFTFVKDVVNYVMGASKVDEAVGEVFNIASEQEVSVNQILEAIAGRLNKKPLVNYVPRLAGDPLRNPADISKAKRIFKLVPNVSINDGIIETIDWYLKTKE